MNRITAGSNGGWVQIMGPASRVDEFKEIEASFTPLQGNLPVNGNLPFSPIDPATFIPALQQVRWPPSRIADGPGQARKQLFVLPGSHYSDPEFSWRWAVAPSAIGFAGSGLGPEHANDLFVGAARTFLDEGYLFEFKFDKGRQHFAFSDPRLKDRVDDNDYKFDEGESESLVAGENFGIVTDIVTGPDGNLYVTSLSNGAVYVITNKNLPGTAHPTPPDPLGVPGGLKEEKDDLSGKVPPAGRGRDREGGSVLAPRASEEGFSNLARDAAFVLLGRQVHDPAPAASPPTSQAAQDTAARRDSPLDHSAFSAATPTASTNVGKVGSVRTGGRTGLDDLFAEGFDGMV
jgi:hypothetical protein